MSVGCARLSVVAVCIYSLVSVVVPEVVVVEQKRGVEEGEMDVDMKCSKTSKGTPTCLYTYPLLSTSLPSSSKRHVAILQTPPVQPLYETEKALSGFSRAWGRSCEGIANPLLGIGLHCDWLLLWEKKAQRLVYVRAELIWWAQL